MLIAQCNDHKEMTPSVFGLFHVKVIIKKNKPGRQPGIISICFDTYIFCKMSNYSFNPLHEFLQSDSKTVGTLWFFSLCLL